MNDIKLTEHEVYLRERIGALEAALRRARSYVLHHDCADASELEALGLTMREIDLAFGSVPETPT
jgi:hypothetical protein